MRLKVASPFAERKGFVTYRLPPNRRRELLSDFAAPASSLEHCRVTRRHQLMAVRQPDPSNLNVIAGGGGVAH